MPALTMCYHTRFDNGKARDLIRRFWNILENDLEYPYFLEFVQLITNTTISSFRNIARYADDARFDRLDLLTVARDAHPKINSIVSSFDPNFNPPLIQVMTEKGICFSINGIFASNLQATEYPEYDILRFYYSPLNNSRHICFIDLRATSSSCQQILSHAPTRQISALCASRCLIRRFPTQFIHLMRLWHKTRYLSMSGRRMRSKTLTT